MRKEIEELAKTIAPETKIEELLGKVESIEELIYLAQIIEIPPHEQGEELSDELKLRALTELAELSDVKLTIPLIQKKMSLGFHNAALIFDWLCGKQNTSTEVQATVTK